MKSVLVFLLYLTGSIVSVHSFLGKVPTHPWFFTTQMLRLQPKHLAVKRRPTHRQDLSKFKNIIYWKHLLELECFKEICNDRSGYKRPFEMMRHRQIPGFRNDGPVPRDQISNLYKMRKNQVESEPQARKKYFANERVILWPPEKNFTQKQLHLSPTGKEFHSSQTQKLESERRGPEKNFKENITVKDFIQQKVSHRLPPQFLSRPTEEDNAFEHLGAFSEEQRTDYYDDALPELFQKNGALRSSTAIYPENSSYAFRQRLTPSRIQPYEVEEIIEEKFIVDMDENDKDKNSFKPFGGRNISGKDIQKPEIKKTTEHFQDVIDSSVNKILKGLISPMVKTVPPPNKDILEAVLPLEKPGKRPFATGVKSSTTSDTLRSFTKHPFYAKANENIFATPFQQQTYSRLKKVQPSEKHYSWRQSTAEAAQQKFVKKLFKPDARVDSSRGFDLDSSFEKEYLKNFLQTNAPKKPPVTEVYEQSFDIFNTNEFQSDLDENLEKKPISGPEGFELPSTATLRTMDLLKNILGDHQSDVTPTEETTNPPTHPPLSLETPSEVLSTTTDSKDFEVFFSEADTTVTTQDFLETVKYFSEASEDDFEETEHNFIEFSDRPMSFDLLTTTIKQDSKKDQETTWKNSRRMHFGHESRKTTLPNKISSAANTGQRRSDILITDNLADYVDDENSLSTLSYFEKLKQNDPLLSPNAHNLTSDELIPFIPMIINDLREGRIPSEDVPILSRALGKYWNPILGLANFTNLDMLPLAKMKDEKDLENVLQNFLPEDKTSTTAGTTKIDSKTYGEYSQSYDYMDEYKDFYKDILDQDLGNRKRRFRYRRDAEDDLKTLEATREYFDSLEEERRDEGSDYIFEDIIYDEVSDGEDESVFEMMEVSDVHIDKVT